MSKLFPGAPLILKIDEGKEISFADTKSILDWYKSESEAWKLLIGGAAARRTEVARKVNNHLQAIDSTATAYQTNPDNARLTDLKHALGNLSSYIERGSYIVSTSPLGRYILEFVPADTELALSIYDVATRGDNEALPQTKVTMLAAGYLANYYSGVGTKAAAASMKSVEDSASSLAKLLSDGSRDLNQLTDVLADDIIQAREKIRRISELLVKSIKSKRVVFEKERKILLETTESETSEAIKAAKESIEEFRDFMEKQISLQVPANYWTRKRDRHRIATIVSATVFLVYVFVVVRYTWSNIVAKYSDVFGFLENWRDASLGVVGVMAGALALVLIFARVLYRMFASQLHLWNDAGERVTMIETYLALAEKGHAKEEFLGALMSRLFLPATDGIVRDDLGAVGPIDLASRWTGGK